MAKIPQQRRKKSMVALGFSSLTGGSLLGLCLLGCVHAPRHPSNTIPEREPTQQRAPGAVVQGPDHEAERAAAEGALPNVKEAGIWLDGPTWSYQRVVGNFNAATRSIEWVVTHPFNDPIKCAFTNSQGDRVVSIGEQGSVGFHSIDGKLLSSYDSRPEESPGLLCSADVFSPSGYQALFAFHSQAVALLSSEGSVELRPASGGPPDTFRESGWQDERHFWIKSGERWASYELPTRGSDVTERQAIEFLDGQPGRLNENRWMTVPVNDDTIALYDVQDGTKLLEVKGDRAYVLGDTWRVELGPEYENQKTAGYRLPSGDVIWTMKQPTPASGGVGPYFPVWAKYGPTIQNIKTGGVLASWKSSGCGCGLRAVTHGSSLAFVEGSLVAFWSLSQGKAEYREDFWGAHYPIPFAEGRKFVALSSVWDTVTQKKVFELNIPDPSQDFTAHALSPDEEFLYGTQDRTLLVWSMTDGSLVLNEEFAGSRWARMQPIFPGLITAEPRGADPSVAVYFDVKDSSKLYYLPLLELSTVGELKSHSLVAFTDECHWGPELDNYILRSKNVPAAKCTTPAPWERSR